MKSVTPYPFNLSAGQTLTLPIEGDYFRIQSATGAVDVTVDSVGTLPDLLTGQGLKNVPFKRLTVKDKTGAANAVVILVAFDDFIDNRTYGVNDLSAGTLSTLRQPLAQTSFFSDQSGFTANTPITVFAPGSNLNGAVILSAELCEASATNFVISYLTKASAPANVLDGSVILTALPVGGVGSNVVYSGRLPKEQFVAAGQGLYMIASSTFGATGLTMHNVRYRLL